MRELKIFSGQANPHLAGEICKFLNLSVGDCSLGQFPDGENFCKIEDVRGRDVFLIQPTCPSQPTASAGAGFDAGFFSTVHQFERHRDDRGIDRASKLLGIIGPWLCDITRDNRKAKQWL